MKTAAGAAKTDIGRVAVVIPAYNHAGKIAGVIREARKLPWPLFVVDDGSTDGTYERIKDSTDVAVIRHGRNLGKGAAILTDLPPRRLRRTGSSPSTPTDSTIQRCLEPHPGCSPRLTRPLIVGRREGMGGPPECPVAKPLRTGVFQLLGPCGRAARISSTRKADFDSIRCRKPAGSRSGPGDFD